MQNCRGGRSHPRGCARFPAEKKKRGNLYRGIQLKRTEILKYESDSTAYCIALRVRGKMDRQMLWSFRHGDLDLKSTDSCQQQEGGLQEATAHLNILLNYSQKKSKQSLNYTVHFSYYVCEHVFLSQSSTTIKNKE